ncbi:hypothetical protein [Kineosporia succinea]|uniref:Uncharacterized protein n=1 Tax=Kineosporia succinea TaxID=84632 RepID=A0ABT9P591_9ACTN|nr:hypothetical protein [Kineosporia succinea]MDP9827642.1 hypothetical protein [Kineosporia succinea]
MARQCVVIPLLEHVDGRIQYTTATLGGFNALVVVEGQVRGGLLSGPSGRPTVWGPTLADAMRKVVEQNRAWGLTEEDVTEILVNFQAAYDLDAGST